jgi:carboxymethylenebutenolidase
MADNAPGSAYLVSPEEGPGPGVLVLHSWWGLNRGVKARVESLADAGFTALAPALLGGPQPVDASEAAQALADADADATAAMILSSVVALRAHANDPDAPVGVLGYSMGASWALWLATRLPDSIAAVVADYGVQSIDFTDLVAPVLCHFADSDPLVSDDDVVEMQSQLLLLEKSIEVHHHQGTRHFFAEEGVPMLDAGGNTGERTHVEAAAADAAWIRTVGFLDEHLG